MAARADEDPRENWNIIFVPVFPFSVASSLGSDRKQETVIPSSRFFPPGEVSSGLTAAGLLGNTGRACWAGRVVKATFTGRASPSRLLIESHRPPALGGGGEVAPGWGFPPGQRVPWDCQGKQGSRRPGVAALEENWVQLWFRSLLGHSSVTPNKLLPKLSLFPHLHSEPASPASLVGVDLQGKHPLSTVHHTAGA